jgi:hypothetical protein
MRIFSSHYQWRNEICLRFALVGSYLIPASMSMIVEITLGGNMDPELPSASHIEVVG